MGFKLPSSFTTVTPLSKTLAMAIFVIFPFVGFYLGLQYQKILGCKTDQLKLTSTNNRPNTSYKLVSEVYFQCQQGKQIKANFFKGPVISSLPGMPPVPPGKVELILSDGRKLNLPQTISASGIRYANEGESVIFWSKGESAFIMENDSETFSDCQQRIWSLGNDKVDKAVTDFLLSQPQLSWKTTAGSTNICIFQNLAPEKLLFPHYLWVRCGEYKMENGQLKELSGTSVPAKLDYPNELSFYDLHKFIISIPRDGSLYDQDIKRIFPEKFWDKLHFESAPLNEKILQTAINYFE